MAAPTAAVNAILKGIGAPVNANTQAAMQEWFAAEGGSNNNWLNVSPGGQVAAYKTQAQGVAATVATINQSNMSSIKQAFATNSPASGIKSAIITSPWSAAHYAGTDYGGGTTNATLADDVTTNPTSDGVTAGPTKLAAPQAGVDIKNFHGYDLSAFTGGDSKYLGEAEQAIEKFVSNPQLESLVVSNNPTDNAEYGYSSFSLKIPQLNAVMITTALAPNGMFDQNTLQGIISNTDWYKQTDQNQRVWQAALVSDPSSAHNALAEAQDKVLATANQVGVKLTKTQLDQIANVYAAQSYTPTNTLGAESGTSQEWLDQAVVNTALNIKATGQVVPGGTNEQYDYANGVTDVNATQSPTDLTGVMQSLYQGLLGAAQSYLLYNPDDPTKGMLSEQDLMNQVDQAMKEYTGTGASGQISQFVDGQVAKYTEQYKQQASSLYPTLAPVIQAGSTPQSYITPLTNYVAQQTGMSQGQINPLDPQWNWIISSPGANGVLGPVTQDQALKKITDPGFSWTDPNGQQMTYMNTNAGQQIQNQFSQQFAAAFGKGA